MKIRSLVWIDLCDSYFKMNYADLIANKFRARDRIIKVIVLLISFGGIGAWFKNSGLDWIWASILLISSLYSLVSDYFPYQKISFIYSKKTREYKKLVRDYSKLFFDIEVAIDGSFSIEYWTLRDKKDDVDFLGEDFVVSIDQGIVKVANELTSSYISRTYQNDHVRSEQATEGRKSLPSS